MMETMPTSQSSDSRNFAREMPKPKVDAATDKKFKAGATQAYNEWQKRVVANSEREAEELAKLNQGIAAGDYQPDPEHYAREMRRPDVADGGATKAGLGARLRRWFSKN